MLSYKLGLMPEEKLWDDLTLEPPTKLYDLMARVEKCARLEEDARFAECLGATSSWGESSIKRHKESTKDRSGRESMWSSENLSINSWPASKISLITKNDLYGW